MIAAIARADTHIVSFTVTEKGYCRGPDGALDSRVCRHKCRRSLLSTSLAARSRRGAARPACPA